MSLRVPITDARLIRKAAVKSGKSAHYWMLTNIVQLAKMTLGETIPSNLESENNVG